MRMYKIAKESVIGCKDELGSIFRANWEETATHNNGFVGADWELVETLEDMGSLVFYTVRDPEDVIVGYCMFIINPMINRRGLLVANNNLIYVHPSCRNAGIGQELIDYAEENLKECGVSVIGIPLKRQSPLMERNGYILDEFNYTKQIG